MKINKVKLKEKLEAKLGRNAKANEIINAETDVALLVDLLSDELEILKERVDNLDKK